MTLTPLIATSVFVIACLAGYNFRRTWASEGPRWQLWLYGTVAGIGLIILGTVPMVG